MGMRKIVGYIRDNVRNYGISATLHDLECQLVNKAVFFQILKGMTVRMQDVTDARLFEAPGFDSRFVAEDELSKLTRESAHQISPEFLHTALARGDRCYALFDGQTLAAYGWYSELRTPLDEHYLLHFDHAWTYMYKGYTMPAYRGKRLHAVGMCQALRALTEEGKNGLISCVASTNFASLQSITRMGFRIFGDVYLMRAGCHSFAYATPGCRTYGFRAEPLASRRDIPGARSFSKER